MYASVRKIVLVVVIASGILAGSLPLGLDRSRPAAAEAPGWETYYEQSGCTATPRYDETIAYCKRLAGASPWVTFESFGTSPEGRDLPLVIADKDGFFSPGAAHRAGKAVLLVQACIHAGECDGKDAGLTLLRDIVISKKWPGLLDHVTLLFIPIFNVDGHERFGPYNRINQNGPKEMGWRVTAQNLNLNRDYLKADAPEMQAWLRLFTKWFPDFFIDCHVTDGADYQYVVTYLIDVFGTLDPGLTRWCRDVYVRTVEPAMAEAGFPLSPYVSFRTDHDPLSGLAAWITPPRLSHGYATIQNRPGLLIETHMLKDYRTRVSGTYEMVKQTMAVLNAEHAALTDLIRRADAYVSSSAFREAPFPIAYRLLPDSVMIDFLGVAYTKVKSDLTGGDWYQWSDKPVTMKIPYFTHYEPSKTIDVPEAYIIPVEWTAAIDRLAMHGIAFERLISPAVIPVQSYRFEGAAWQEQPYEGRHAARYQVLPLAETRSFPAGSAVVPMNQRAARVVIHLLEPEGPDALVRWGFFDAIFEQKEYTESYVMEKMARAMLSSDPDLKKEFEEKKAGDAEFASDPRAILNWFYRHTPYWDDRMDVYPIGKIMDRAALESLEYAK
jgi:murein tripeptide amidase MpaA